MLAISRNNDARAVARLQEWLTNLSYTCKADGVFGRLTQANLQLWQRASGLVADGIFGPRSFEAMRGQIRDFYTDTKFERGSTNLPADAHKGSKGFNFTRLRSDVAPAYLALYNEAKEHGILVTSAGGVRALSASVGVGRSATSLHYAGIAFDMALDSGAMNPETDAFVLEALEGRRWRVWARVFDEDALKAPKQLTTIQNPITYSKRNGTGQPVTGLFVDFTELANKHGWRDIPAHNGWQSTRAITVLEWWHFQFEGVLMPQFSSFGGEVLGLYDQATINNFPAIARRAGRIWQKDWFG